MKKSFVSIIGCVFLGSLPAFSSEMVHTPHVAWSGVYSQDDWMDECPCLISGPDGGVYVVGHSSKKIEEQYRTRLWIWRLDGQGKRLWARTPNAIETAEKRDITWSKVICDSHDRVFFAQESLPKTGIWLIRFDQEGQVTFTQRLAFKGLPGIWKMAQTRGGFLVAGGASGKDGSDAWISKLDPNGAILWDKTYDHGQSECAHALEVYEDGGFAWAASSGTYNKFGAGPSKVWVVVCDADGKVLRDKTLEGRHPTLSHEPNGHLVLCYNAVDVFKVKQQIMGLDSSLNPVWGPHLVFDGEGLGMYNLLSDSAGNTVVAGSTFGALRLWTYSPQGQALGSISVKEQFSGPLVNTLILQDNAILLAAAGQELSPEKIQAERMRASSDHMDILIARIQSP